MKIDFDYNKGGIGYANYRRTDPRIAKYIHEALGSAGTVLNIGAGSGSYEPGDRYVVAVEPSEVMRAQRKTPAVIAAAESLPFDDNAFDASMALTTIHHWKDLEKGLREMRRVTKGAAVILTSDAYADSEFWLYDYAPEIADADKMRYPKIEIISGILGGTTRVQAIPVPLDCEDGIQEAFYARPELLLDPVRRRSQSTWSFLAEGVEERIVNAIARDLESGEWEKKYGEYRTKPEIKTSWRLVINTR
jgi:SAM-dependent methyltransferase